MKAIPSVYHSWPTVPLQFETNAIKTAKECADEKSYWGKCHEVYSTFLVSWCIKSAELAKQRTAAGNQNQLSNVLLIWRSTSEEKSRICLYSTKKSVHHIMFPMPKLSVLQLGRILRDYNSYIHIYICIVAQSHVYI